MSGTQRTHGEPKGTEGTHGDIRGDLGGTWEKGRRPVSCWPSMTIRATQKKRRSLPVSSTFVG